MIVTERRAFLRTLGIGVGGMAVPNILFGADNLVDPTEFENALSGFTGTGAGLTHQADASVVTLFGDPDNGAWTVAANKDAALSIAQDVLQGGGYDQVVFVKPTVNQAGTAYSLTPITSYERLTSSWFEERYLYVGLNRIEPVVPSEGGVVLVGGRRVFGRRFQDCSTCCDSCPTQSGRRQVRASGACGSCAGGNCNIPIGYGFTHLLQAFRRVYPRGERPGLVNRVKNLIAPRLRAAKGFIDCHQAEILLARRALYIIIGVSVATMGGGGAGALVIF